MRRSTVVFTFALGCAPEPDWFDESRYVLESMQGRDLAPDSRIEVRFHGREIAAFPGCQEMFGAYRLERGIVVVEGGLYTYEHAITCGSAVDDQQVWMKGFLNEEPSYEVDGPRLELSDDVVTMVLLDE